MEATFPSAPSGRLVDKYESTLERLVRSLEVRDLETQGHTFRVTGLAVRLAEALGIQGEALLNVRRGALLHDIGKLDVPASILHKKERLSPGEMEIVRQHPQNAYNRLSRIDFPDGALEIPYCHHEKWDGSGYPRGLKEKQIPVSARLFAVVDVYDAMTANRSYRAAMPREDVLLYLKYQKGRQFDPDIVEVFLGLIVGT
jgi:putative nucleotidyltransferase with HDIG domain